MYVGIAIWAIVVALFFYLLIMRPQQRRMSAVRTLQSELREGDEVMTTSGIYGRITKIDESNVEVEIAPNTVIRMARGAIGERIVSATGSDDADAE